MQTKDEPMEEFTLEDIIREFGSGQTDWDAPQPQEPAAPQAQAQPEARPLPQKGTVPFQTSRLPKIDPEDAALDAIVREFSTPEPEAQPPQAPEKLSRQERKAARAAQKEAAREVKRQKKLNRHGQAADTGKAPVPAASAPAQQPAATAAEAAPAPLGKEAPAAKDAEAIPAPVAKEEPMAQSVATAAEVAPAPAGKEAPAAKDAEAIPAPVAKEEPAAKETAPASEADQREPGSVSLEELSASVAALGTEMDTPPAPEPQPIVEKMPDPVHTAVPASEPAPTPRPTRRQAAAQSAAELGLMSDAELDAIIREFSDEPLEPYRQQERLENLEQTLRADLRSAQPSDFFEQQFGGYAGADLEPPEPDVPVTPTVSETPTASETPTLPDTPADDVADDAEDDAEEELHLFGRRRKHKKQAEETAQAPQEPAEEPAQEPAEEPAQPEAADQPAALQIPLDAEPNVPFTVQIPADAAAPAEPPKPGKKNAVPFHTASLPRMAEPEEEPEDDDTEFFPKRKKKAKKPPVEAEPVGTARDACVQYGKQLKANKLRLRLGFVTALLSLALTAYYSLDWKFIGILSNASVVAWALNLLLVLSAFLCLDVFRTAAAGAKQKQFGLECLLTLASVLALLDGILAGIRGRVPYCATASVLLWLALWGRCLQAEGMYRTMKVLDKHDITTGIVRSENVFRGNAALFTAEASEEEFMEHIRKPSLAEQVLQIYTPLAVLLTLILALVAAIKGSANFLQCWTPMLLAAVPASGLLCYGRTFALLAKRLAKRGAALCGWYGACALGNNAAVLLRDEDLFPVGMMEPNGVKSFNGYTGNQVVGYAAAVMGKAGSGLAPVLDSLLERDGGHHMQCDAIRLYENGGIGGKFGSDAILVGTLAFMHRMGVHMTTETRVKRATYVSVNGELAGLIAMRYSASGQVRDAVGILTRSGRTKPVLATCNVSITPKLLKLKFHVAPERVSFPDLRERAELAARSADPASTLCAVMANQHIATFADVAVGGRILQTVVKAGLVMAILSGLIGICVLGVLSLTGAIAGLSASYLLLFDIIWMIPVMLLTGWTRSY